MSFTVTRAVDLLRVYARKAGVAQENIPERLLLKFLNIAQDEVVVYVLSLAKKQRSVYDLFTGVMATTDISLVSEGYALADLSTPGLMASPDAFIRAEATIDSVKQRVVRRSADQEGLAQNQYLAGNDEYPLLYFENNKIMLDADAGTEPTLTYQYIRKPKELVARGATGYQVTTCELTYVFEKPIMLMAEAEIEKIKGDLNKYDRIRKEAFEYLGALVSGGDRDGPTGGQMLRSYHEPERK
jgi:hypothetical protein